MLKDILSITGKSGLFKMITQAKNMIIVESLIDGKRTPAHARDKVISLGDISIFTTTDDVSLGEVFNKMKEKEGGKKASIEPKKASNEALKTYLEELIPNFDNDRVYPTDIKKIINWYNLLIDNNMTDFLPIAEEAKTETAKEEETEQKAKAVKEKKTSTQKTANTRKVAPKTTKANNTKSVTNRKMGG